MRNCKKSRSFQRNKKKQNISIHLMKKNRREVNFTQLCAFYRSCGLVEKFRLPCLANHHVKEISPVCSDEVSKTAVDKSVPAVGDEEEFLPTSVNAR